MNELAVAHVSAKISVHPVRRHGRLPRLHGRRAREGYAAGRHDPTLSRPVCRRPGARPSVRLLSDQRRLKLPTICPWCIRSAGAACVMPGRPDPCSARCWTSSAPGRGNRYWKTRAAARCRSDRCSSRWPGPITTSPTRSSPPWSHRRSRNQFDLERRRRHRRLIEESRGGA